jgi:myo-inositol-1(or 4)-monophosphatase
VIYDPNLEECYSARLGGGAFLNESAIAVTGISHLEKSLLATGFPYDDFGREEKYIALFRDLMRKTRGMRRLGSAALDLAWTACGRFEGFYEYGLNPWDMAAGIVIVREAGGVVTTFHGNDSVVFADDMIASNGQIHPEISTVIQRHF